MLGLHASSIIVPMILMQGDLLVGEWRVEACYMNGKQNIITYLQKGAQITINDSNMHINGKYFMSYKKDIAKGTIISVGSDQGLARIISNEKYIIMCLIDTSRGTAKMDNLLTANCGMVYVLSKIN